VTPGGCSFEHSRAHSYMSLVRGQGWCPYSRLAMTDFGQEAILSRNQPRHGNPL
jgi:hypothetical protein